MRAKVLVLMTLALSACRKVEDARTSAVIGADDSLSIGGFSTPESAQYDSATDAYYVSNINGTPLAKTNNGFISRVNPNGTMEFKFIDAARPEITLNAPKGIAIKGDTMFVADIDTVRLFSISKQSVAGGWAVPGATFLNDVAIGPDGSLYVSDTGLNAEFQPTGTEAVYRFDASGHPIPIAKGSWLSGPNGLVVGPEGVTVVTFGSNVVMRIKPGSPKVDTVARLPGGQLDGVVRRSANDLFVSSWEAKAVFHVDAVTGSIRPVFTQMESPADIGYDTKRQRILIPLFTKDRLEIRKAP